jgi:hypothetical protein
MNVQRLQAQDGQEHALGARGTEKTGGTLRSLVAKASGSAGKIPKAASRARSRASWSCRSIWHPAGGFSALPSTPLPVPGVGRARWQPVPRWGKRRFRSGGPAMRRVVSRVADRGEASRPFDRAPRFTELRRHGGRSGPGRRLRGLGYSRRIVHVGIRKAPISMLGSRLSPLG